MSSFARPKGRQRSSSSDEDVVFVASMATVRGARQAYGVVGTRAVLRARGAGPLRSVARGRRGRPVRGAWGPPRGVPIGRGVGRPLDGPGGRAAGHPPGGPVVRSSGRPSGGPVVGGASVIVLGSPPKRPHSPSSDDESVVCLGEVAPTGKFVPRCVP